MMDDGRRREEERTKARLKTGQACEEGALEEGAARQPKELCARHTPEDLYSIESKSHSFISNSSLQLK